MSKKEPEKSTPDLRILQTVEVRPIRREERAQWDALVRQPKREKGQGEKDKS